MVKIFITFTCRLRDRIWELHLSDFQCILPYFFRYDHTNYAWTWGAVHLEERNQLPKNILHSFIEANFVVKVEKSKFSQIDPDQSQEWLNGTSKKADGIVGITRTASALSR